MRATGNLIQDVGLQHQQLHGALVLFEEASAVNILLQVITETHSYTESQIEFVAVYCNNSK